ncbi:RNA polymerase, sigma-24 subunit, ECF subfamily [Xylanimonas cellulosilytica DSM 15894]|uniref:RNA polymerase, sigma-24 subunit, ECF subfamily n=1 Tax=Xylanimonas cellulosilytica (strain DSM 15894 / JCM 12276 / CECT 5975 / KCTC 9989 / LMG 20990 / NBRC 107835 / XIL07) TaxID=446471 RepID=D1BRL3_XYLCX|nr:sigma-70 family RNA polymerase sigma factor [Xylanimonas cellulosilytica]ACZ32279.1 RNA polymerase, sigma-24 subunit, ECF subfamily [Xylanimonas cellulosilytica DSM 15894]
MTQTLAGDSLATTLDAYRSELTGYCYRLLGGAADADDAVQETMVRAWRAYDRFEGRSSLRSWLYRIATNVCFDHLGSAAHRRERPMGLGAAQPPELERFGDVLPEARWVEPVPDDAVLPRAGDPAQMAVGHESIRLAFVAALQYLPPRQRAVLVLREVLRWSAAEVADLLDMTVAAVNSALQRARATLQEKAPTLDTTASVPGEAWRDALLERYLDAFERYDMDELVTLLREDAILNMPPYSMWVQGRDDVVAWMLGPGAGCRGSRCLPVRANGSPAYGQYRPDPVRGGHSAWGLAVLEVDPDGPAVTGITTFLDTATWFPRFGLPLHLPPTPASASGG